MDFTDEEKKILKSKYGEELSEHFVHDGLLNSYYENDHEVQIIYGYIKRILIEVAKKRNLEIDDNITFDIDDLLKNIIEVPEELGDFDVLKYKKYDELSEYVDGKTKGMSWDDLDFFKTCFSEMTDSFRSFMSKHIPKLDNNIDMLNNEINVENSIKYKNPEDIIMIEEEEEFVDSEDDGDWPDWEETKNPEDIIIIDEEEDHIEIIDEEEDNRAKITDEELIDLIKYINIYSQLFECKANGEKVYNELYELSNVIKLKEFYSNEEFYEEFKRIMSHDPKKNRYRFHGTQDLESAGTIISEGLGMMRENLDTTSYIEFTMDQLILYSRGLGGAIGRSAVVIIDEPIEIDGKIRNVVEPLTNNHKIHFSPSGLQGFGRPQYIVNPQYIVGYVDKINKKIIYNPRYYNYERFNFQTNSELEEMQGSSRRYR